MISGWSTHRRPRRSLSRLIAFTQTILAQAGGWRDAVQRANRVVFVFLRLDRACAWTGRTTMLHFEPSGIVSVCPSGLPVPVSFRSRSRSSSSLVGVSREESRHHNLIFPSRAVDTSLAYYLSTASDMTTGFSDVRVSRPCLLFGRPKLPRGTNNGTS